MSIPDAVLSAFIEAKGAREATRAIEGVQESLREATNEANLATAAVNRFGRVRGIAVLDVDAAKARARIAAASKDVDAFDRESATAVLEANGNGVTRSVVKASAEVQSFARERGTATLDVDTSKLAAMSSEVRRAGGEVSALGDDFGGLRGEKSKTDKLIDRNIGTFSSLAKSIGITSASTVMLRGSLGPISGGLGVVAGAALFFGVALIALIGPAIAVAAALAPLSGLAAGMAGGLVAAATGFGVFKLATMGVADALKEQTKLSATAGQGALQQAGQEVAASRAIRAAQEGLRSAREGVSRAAEQLTEATRAERLAVAALGPAYSEARMRLRDMRDAVTSSNLSLRDARQVANDARKALSELLAGPSPRVLADAHRAVADAVRGERSAVEGLADAHKALNDLLSPPAVLDLADARDAVADATRGETRAARELRDQIAATNAVLADPGASEDDKALARERLADAENAVGDAARASARAQEALAKLEGGPAQDEIARARGRVRDAEEAVAASRRETLDAQIELAKIESGPSSTELANARLALAQAEHGLSTAVKDATRAAREYGVAEAAGLARSPAVLAARDALRSAAVAGAAAERGLADAERQEALAARGVGEAQADAARSAALAGASAGLLSQKMAGLPAPAQAFVRQLEAMKPRLDELRAAAAGGFFPGAGAGLTAAAQSFEPVRRVVAATALVLGDLTRRAGELVGSAGFGKDIETIGTRNATVLDTMGTAVLHLVSALRHVLVAAGPLTQWLADVANKWALNAAEAAKAGRESGKMAEFFEKTRAVAQRLGSILGHLASGLFGVGKAGTDTGNDILASIDAAAKRFDEWANSVRGQSSIREFFERTKEIAAALLPALANVASGFALLALKLLPVVTMLKLLGPVADEAIVAFVAFKIAISAATIASKLWAAGVAIATFATGGWATAFWALNAAMAANPIGLVVVAIAALVAGLILAYKNSETFRNIVDGALRAVGAAFTWLWNAAKDVFEWLKSNWPLVLGILTGPVGLAVLMISGHADSIVEFFKGLPARIGEAIKAGAAFFADAVVWIGEQIVGGIKAYLSFYAEVGRWVVNRLVDGVKAMGSAIADAAGWLKNRVVEGVHALALAYVGLGSWVLNRIVDGLKVVGEALLSVGAWLKNRVVEIVQFVAGSYVAVGGWILNRIVDGFKVVSEALGSVGSWLRARVGELLDAAKGGFLELGGKIIGWIVDGLKSGANLLVDFVNKIIDVINKIPGVDLDHIKGFAEGGKVTADPGGVARHAMGGVVGGTAQQAFAHGGFFAKTGGYMDMPVALGGEESPRFAEWVIPENPAYRGRALKLWQAAGDSLGATGFAEGGVVSAFKDAIRSTHASQKPSLALFEAGIVESGLRNLTYGDRDSLGALQVRAGIHGRDLAMSPLRSALAFLTRGFTGRGGAIELARSLDTAGQVAQAVQGSAFPDRYDQVRGEAMQYLGDGGGGIGGIISDIGGALGDLLSKGAGWLLDKLPGVGDLPDWLKGTGRYALDAAGKYIREKVGELLASATGGNAGAPLPEGVSGDIQDVIALAQGRGFARPSIGQLSGGQHARDGYHPLGRAADFGDAGHSVREMLGLFNAIEDRYGARIRELYYDRSGHYVKNGQSIAGHFGGHGDHIHAALREGGLFGGVLGSYANGTDYVPRDGAYYLHRGESVAPAGGSDDIEVHVIFDGLPVELQKLVRVEVTRRDRVQQATWRGGVA